MAAARKATREARRRHVKKREGNVDEEDLIGERGPRITVYGMMLGMCPSLELMEGADSEGHTGAVDHGYDHFFLKIGRASIIIILRVIPSRFGNTVAMVGETAMSALSARTRRTDATMRRWGATPLLPRGPTSCRLVQLLHEVHSSARTVLCPLASKRQR